MAYASQGSYENALQQLFTAEELCLNSKNNTRLALVLDTMAFVYYSQKKLPKALEAMERSIALARNINVPANVASSLSNIALVQFQLGKAKGALNSINEAIELSSETSKNFHAQALGNRAEILAYLGHMEEARKGYDRAISLLKTMDLEPALAEAYLSKGLDLHADLNEWEEMENSLVEAQKLLEYRQESFPEKTLRLKIGLGTIAFQKNEIQAALTYFDAVENQIAESGFDWWYPQTVYLKGVVKRTQGDILGARALFLRGLESIMREEGCPDYKPLLLLELCRLESKEKKRVEYLLACARAAEVRARELNRRMCLAFVSETLSLSEDPELRRMGEKYKSIPEPELK
jgi:tetratricopeptide (TPR) repeat protein